MKKEEKRSFLKIVEGTYTLCKCNFEFSENNFNYYILGSSNNLFYVANEEDFIINGFEIRNISDLDFIDINRSACSKINEINKLLANLNAPNIDLCSWETVINSIKKLNKYCIIQNEYDDMYYIGEIIRVTKDNVYFKHFDSFGKWEEELYQIPLSSITSISFDDRYSTTWQKYLTNN